MIPNLTSIFLEMGWFNHQLDQTLRILGNSRTTLPETNSKSTWKVDFESMIFRTPGRVTWRATWWRLGQSRSSTFRSLGPQPPRCHGVAGCYIIVIVSITPEREECVFCVFVLLPKVFWWNPFERIFWFQIFQFQFLPGFTSIFPFPPNGGFASLFQVSDRLRFGPDSGGHAP